MLEGATNYYEKQLNAPFEPTPAALRDRERVLAGLRAAMLGKLPRSVARGLDIEAIINAENIIAAIKSLHRESTPGVDMMPLDFYIANLQRIAPQLSALYRELLQRGAVSQTMRHAVLSPLYKEKGERHDPKMYRPVSVTTIEYRILGRTSEVHGAKAEPSHRPPGRRPTGRVQSRQNV